MIRQLNPKRNKEVFYIEKFYKIWWDFNNPPLILTDEDQISVGELKKQFDCPVKKCLEKMRDTQKVFFKKDEEQWAFSLRKD